MTERRRGGRSAIGGVLRGRRPGDRERPRRSRRPAARRAFRFGTPLLPLLTAALVATAFLTVREGGENDGNPMGAPSPVATGDAASPPLPPPTDGPAPGASGVGTTGTPTPGTTRDGAAEDDTPVPGPRRDGTPAATAARGATPTRTEAEGRPPHASTSPAPSPTRSAAPALRRPEGRAAPRAARLLRGAARRRLLRHRPRRAGHRGPAPLRRAALRRTGRPAPADRPLRHGPGGARGGHGALPRTAAPQGRPAAVRYALDDLRSVPVPDEPPPRLRHRCLQPGRPFHDRRQDRPPAQIARVWCLPCGRCPRLR